MDEKIEKGQKNDGWNVSKIINIILFVTVHI